MAVERQFASRVDRVAFEFDAGQINFVVSFLALKMVYFVELLRMQANQLIGRSQVLIGAFADGTLDRLDQLDLTIALVFSQQFVSKHFWLEAD